MLKRLTMLVFMLLFPYVAHAQGAHFVSAKGEALYLDGKPYIFLGVNRYNLLTMGGPPYVGCGRPWSEADLDLFFSEIHGMGANVIRFWAFQSFTVNAQGGNFNRMDYIVNTLASKYHIKVIPVLENEWKDCTKSGKKYDNWYQSGYSSPYGDYALSYKDYVKLIVSRYKDSPNILMWQLMNEAEDKNTDGSCANGDGLYRFTSSMSVYIHKIDHNHMVSLGTIGTGQCGTAGMYTFQKLHSIPSLNIIEAHDYGHDVYKLPGYPVISRNSSTIASDLLVSHVLKKPLFIGEAGIKSDCAEEGCFDEALRSQYFNAKIRALLANGGVGYIIWSYRDNNPKSFDHYNFNHTDPLYSTLKNLAQKYEHL